MRAATQQRDSTEVVINRVLPLSIQFPQGQSIGGSAVNIWQELRNSSFYSNYAPMYDQVKLCGVRAKINGSIQGTNTSSYLTPTIITAWDRNGLSGISTPADNISTYSSAISKPWSLGNAFVQTRSIYASTMSEKSQYVSPQSLDLAVSDVNNPCNPTQIQAIPFKPQLLVQISLPTGAALGGQTMAFNVELDIICKFRGLRKGAQPTDPSQIGSINFPLVITGLGTSTGTPIPFSSFTTVSSNSVVSVPDSGTIIELVRSVEGLAPYLQTNTNSLGSARNYTVSQGNSYLVLTAAQLPPGTILFPVTSNAQTLPGINSGSTTEPNNITLPPSGYSWVGFPSASV